MKYKYSRISIAPKQLDSLLDRVSPGHLTWDPRSYNTHVNTRHDFNALIRTAGTCDKQQEKTYQRITETMMTSSNGNIFRVTGHFMRGIHRSPVNSPHKCQWRGALMFSFACAWTNSRVTIGDAADLRRNRSHSDVLVMHILDTSDLWL